MSFDWSQTANIDESMVVYRSVPEGYAPRVTIAMPTFNRAETIKKSLASIGKQRFLDFVFVVSDNAGRNPETLKAIKELEGQLPAVILIAQPENKGALHNLHYLLTIAKTEYFMWLADDDEISENYLQDLITLLDKDENSVAAFGYWRFMYSPTEGKRQPQSQHTSKNLFIRAIKYVGGKTDDALFYGLHRTACLRKCRFGDYIPPNKGVLTNWCYVFLFDLILQGPIAYAKDAVWIYHDYIEKQYSKAMALNMADRFKTLIRRLNVYALYCVKAFGRNPLLLPPVFIASIYGLLRDVVSAVCRMAKDAV